MHGTPAPANWFGLVDARPYLIEGIGAIYQGVDGHWWITFQRCPGVGKVLSAHKAAKQLLGLARERGLAVHALAEPGIAGAEMWLSRLGFERTHETRQGHPVWVRKF